jgi:hypothetical protein
MSNLAQQFNDMDETHLAMSCPIELAKYITELKDDISMKDDIINGYKKQADDAHIRFLDEQQRVSDHSTEYVEQLKEEIESLKRQECVNLRDTLKIKLEDEEKIEKLEKENKMWRLSGIVMREFTDPKGYYTNIEDYVAFDEFIKGHYPEEYEDLYEWFDIDSQLYEDEDEE